MLQPFNKTCKIATEFDWSSCNLVAWNRWYCNSSNFNWKHIICGSCDSSELTQIQTCTGAISEFWHVIMSLLPYSFWLDLMLISIALGVWSQLRIASGRQIGSETRADPITLITAQLRSPHAGLITTGKPVTNSKGLQIQGWLTTEREHSVLSFKLFPRGKLPVLSRLH